MQVKWGGAAKGDHGLEEGEDLVSRRCILLIHNHPVESGFLCVCDFYFFTPLRGVNWCLLGITLIIGNPVFFCEFIPSVVYLLDFSVPLELYNFPAISSSVVVICYPKDDAQGVRSSESHFNALHSAHVIAIWCLLGCFNCWGGLTWSPSLVVCPWGGFQVITATHSAGNSSGCVSMKNSLKS